MSKIAIVMDHRVDIYIPSQCICSETLPLALRAQVMEEVKNKFDSWFGAHSEIPIKGDWRLPDGTIAVEEVADIFAFCTSEALQQHHDAVDQLAVEIANRLTQDRVLRVFDNLKVALWPNTIESLKPKKNCACHGGAMATVGLQVEAIGVGKADRLSRLLVMQGILRSFNSVDHARKLFCDVLNYHYATGVLPFSKWPDSIRLLVADAPNLLAEHNGFKVIYLRLASELRRGAERQVILRICKDDPTFRGLVVVSDKKQESWELINLKAHVDDSKRFVLRRMRVGVDAIRTATERIAMLGITEQEEDSITAEELQVRHDAAFDVESVTREFFSDIANWYFWALKHVHFPKDAPKDSDGHDQVSVIRLITRLMFCWFVKEKGLISDKLFNERKLEEFLIGFEPGKTSNKDSVFYKAILQNLFFATLNMEMDKRHWRKNGQNFMAHSLYRYKELFVRPNEVLALFKDIPFLNGGLFECLDKDLGEHARPRYVRIDGFSDRVDSQPTVPDFLFFDKERELDLSKDYGDIKFKSVKVRGLIHTLNHYRFTIEESTPLEEEVALDPELAGKIFENLLAAYNPETGATARKQTGSFYTPREIVNYMVDEALIAYLKGKIERTFPEAIDMDQRLRHLFSYGDEGHQFMPKEVEVLIVGIDQLKALDPAVGSGAFPMGILHKLVFILGRLDPRNEQWKERQKQRLGDAMATTERIEDATIRENTLRELEQQLAGIDEAFEKNALDYGRKLYLIENCLYGVDIQPIAVQIAKMRFFISLIADQKIDRETENLGVRPLPNLETKLVAANTLVSIEGSGQLSMRTEDVKRLENRLREIRDRHFRARTTALKEKCRAQDKVLRNEISKILKLDGWEDAAAKELAGWDPYDQNSTSRFFDVEWMFNIQNRFDVVLGNPPYLNVHALNRQAPDFVAYLRAHYRCAAKGEFDLYAAFIEKSVELSSDILALIVPSSWYTGAASSSIRRFFITNTDPIVFVNLPYDVFSAAWIDTTVFVSRKRSTPLLWPRTEPHIVKLKQFSKRASLSDAGAFHVGIVDADVSVWFRDGNDEYLTRADAGALDLIQKLKRNNAMLGTCADVQRGVTPFKLTERKSHRAAKQAFSGTLRRYYLDRGEERFIRFDETLAELKPERYFQGPRVLLRELISRKFRLQAATATADFVTNKSIQTILPTEGGPHVNILLACINSKLLSWYFLQVSNIGHRDDFPKIVLKETRTLPIPHHRADDGKYKQTCIELIGLVKQLQKATTSGDIKTAFQLDCEVDRYVYRLYDLTEEEIAIVEEQQ